VTTDAPYDLVIAAFHCPTSLIKRSRNREDDGMEIVEFSGG
jgi:hypothetical protein